MRTYTTKDGLETSDFGNLVRDGRGYLWICPRAGLTRFDGDHFVNYRIDDPSAPQGIFCIHEVDGRYWVDNTNGGLYRYTPAPEGPLAAVPPRRPVADGRTVL